VENICIFSYQVKSIVININFEDICGKKGIFVELCYLVKCRMFSTNRIMHCQITGGVQTIQLLLLQLEFGHCGIYFHKIQ
jgi:hypothetical protein